MKNTLILLIAVLISTLYACNTQKTNTEEKMKILVFTKTEGYHHESISSGIKMLKGLSEEENWTIFATDQSELIRDSILESIDVVVFLNPSGDALCDEGQAAMEGFFKQPKGFVGIHAAADCEYDWPFYGELVGAYFKTHPPAQEASIIFESFDHPAMKPFEGMETYTTFDEWYSFRKNPRENVNVLATLDESSIKEFENDDFKMGDHPIIWWNEENGVRSFYTGFGHTHETFQNELIINHIKNAVNWAGKRTN